MTLDPVPFVRKWNASQLTERSAAPQHFRDLCEMLGVPHPTEEDATGASYTFEKRVAKAGTGEQGYADVWKRGWFAWEYKSKGGDLKKAYKQLNEYHEALDNPPLLVVCDFTRFEVHTKFENLPSRTYAFTLDDLLHDRDTPTCALPPLEVLRHVFGDFNQLRPTTVSARVTEAAAADFLRLAQRLELERAAAPDRPSKEAIAHFLMRLVFCLFADSVGLLPNHAFRRLVENHRFSPLGFNRILPALFTAMSEPHGFFGADTIPYFNGGLFTDHTTIELDLADLGVLYSASRHDWSHIEPAIFGTLFERSLDQAKRSLIGAHYTSTEDILLLIEPVVIQPLQRRWQTVKAEVLAALAQEQAPSIPSTNPGAPYINSEVWVSTESTPAATPGTLSSPATNPGAPGLDSETRVSTTSAKMGSRAATAPKTIKRPTQPTLRLNRPALRLLQDWAAELSSIRILDPACGSGNFLYVALKRLLDLWHEARIFGLGLELALALDPMPSPTQLYGIEIDFYAHEIASIVVWIGFLQWKHDHGIKDEKEPLLKKLSNIEHADAILRYNAEGKPYEPQWPQTDYIIGNPPFLGGKLLRREMGDTYVDAVFELYRGRVKAESDLVVYWFEKARRQLELRTVDRVGLLATQAIRGGANRAVLERIQQTGTIFWAWSDRKWLLKGATVHVSMIAFESLAIPEAATGSENPGAPGLDSETWVSTPGTTPGASSSPADASPPVVLLNEVKDPCISPLSPTVATPTPYLLDGIPVSAIHADLTTGSNTASALRLKENNGICFMGITKVGPFDIDSETARKMLSAPLNPNGRPNSDVVKPWVNALDITRRPRNMFIIDFGTDTTEATAALYELPFEYVRHHVLPERVKNRRQSYADAWWTFGEPRSALRTAIRGLNRYIATPLVSKHRLFKWQSAKVISENLVNVIARSDDYFFGVLHSCIHEVWALTMGTQLESRPRYTPESTFLTFPFPWPPGAEPTESEDSRVQAIAEAARTLARLRDAWLNPPGISEADLKDRTLTKLYNLRAANQCAWLENAHRTLDEAVLAAYNWPSDLTTQEVLTRLLALNHQRAANQ